MFSQELQKSLIERTKQLVSLPYRRSLLSMRQMSEHEFWAEQLRRFQVIYADAIEHVPYYKERSGLYNRKPLFASNVFEAVSLLPVLDKVSVKQNPDDFYRVPKKLFSAEHTTGGTTGTPMRIRASLLERGFTNAILEDRNLDLTGERYPRTVRLSGFLRSSHATGDLFRTVPGTPFAYLSIYDLDAARRSEIRDYIEGFQPKVFHGYASAIHQFSLLFDAADPLKLFHRPVVISTSETLFDHQRKDIEQRLGAIVVNEYGSQEGQHLVLECVHHKLHIHPARGVVEILDPATNRPAEPGARGSVVVTGLMNQSMPLLRYSIGDTAISTGYATGCECGLSWPTIGAVEGRTEDLVRTRDGRRIGLLAHSTLKDLAGIREAQIIQRGYDDFIFRIVVEAEAEKSIIEKHISQEMYARVSPDLKMEFQYIDKLPRTEAGKVRAVIVDFNHNDEP